MVEILIAVVFLTLALVAVFSFFTSSNRGTMDAYRETFARYLALEALEWVSGLGYEKLRKLHDVPNNPLADRLGLNTFMPISSILLDDGTAITYAPDYRLFERKIELLHRPAERVFLVRVTIRPRDSGAWRRGRLMMQKIVGAECDD